MPTVLITGARAGINCAGAFAPSDLARQQYRSPHRFHHRSPTRSSVLSISNE